MGAEKITLVANDWCPYTCLDKERPGVGIEVATQVFQQLGFEVEYIVKNSETAEQFVSEHPMRVLVGAGRSYSPTLVFPAYHFSYVRFCYINEIKGWRYQKLSSLEGKRLGAEDGAAYGTQFGRVITHMSDQGRLKRYSSDGELVAALVGGEVDVILADKNAIKYLLKQQQIVNRYDYDNCSRSKLMFAFSPYNEVHSEELARRADVVLLEMLKDGRVKDIHRKYGVKNY